jgi:hypothetical protein
MVGLVWSIDPESYDVGSISTARTSHVKQGYPGSPSWGLGCEANNLTSALKRILRNVTDLEQDLIIGQLLEGIQSFTFLGILVNSKKCNK